MKLPAELLIIEDDLAGKYKDHHDCPLARALKRAGVPMSYIDGYSVGGTFILDNRVGEAAGFYAWDNGEVFNTRTLREGRLVYKPEETS